MALAKLKPRLQTISTNLIKTITTGTKRAGYRERSKYRKEVLDNNPLCVICQSKGDITAATQIDHIIPLWQGGSESQDNRQGLCDKCHKDKTKREMSRRWRA